MSKVLKVIIALFLSFAIVAAFIYWDCNINSPTNFKVTYLNIEDQQVPDNFKDVKILYFSDLCYGSIFDKEHLQKLEKAISSLDYDIVIFGGDLFDADYSAVSDDVNLLTNFFSGLDCRLGKFFILGDFDKVSDTRSILVKKVLGDAFYEEITSEMKLYNGLNGYITLSSSDSTVEPNKDTYNIRVLHSVDAYDASNEAFNLVLLGDSHARQTDPFIQMKYKLGMSDNLYRVKSVGLTQKSYRVFNYPELLLIRY